MNYTDYRIRSRKDIMRGIVRSTTTKNGINYANVVLSDGRQINFVQTNTPVSVGQRVLLKYDSGRWFVEE